jgi:transposase
MGSKKNKENQNSVRPSGRPPSGKYAQRWAAYNQAQVREKKHFLLLLRELSKCVEEPKRERGRPPLRLPDMIFCSVFKSYSTLSSRHVMSDIEEAHAKGLITSVPHFNAVPTFLRDESVTPFLERLVEQSSYPLAAVESDFAADATGLSTRVRSRWYNRHKGRHQLRREWVGLHVICGVRTNIITCARAGGCREDENKFFEELLRRTAHHFNVAEVSADSGYLDNRNLRQVALLGATPYINFRSNCTATGEFKSSVWKGMLHMYHHRRAEFARHYYKRNNVESTFAMLKAKFGDRLRSKGLRAQINEALCKVLSHNICVLIQSMYELKIDPYSFTDPPPRPSVTEARLMGCAHSEGQYGLVKEKIPPSRDYGRAAAAGREWCEDIKPRNEAKLPPATQPMLPMFS